MSKPTRKEVLEASIQSQQQELEQIQRDEATNTRAKFAQQSLTTIRGIVASSRESVSHLDASVVAAFTNLESAVAAAHEQGDQFYAMTASGSRAADVAANNLKNLVAARFVARRQLAAHEAKLAEQENFFTK